MAKIKVKKEQVLEAIKNAHGLKTGVCEILGIARSTLDRYIEADPEVAEALAFAKVRPTDRAEYKLFEAIERGESWAVMFRLKNAKDREYSERMDISNSDGSLQPKLTDDERLSRMKQLAAAIAEEIKKDA